MVKGEWSDQQFSAVSKRVRSYDYEIHYSESDLEALKTFLMGKRKFLLGLLENPNLLEHETFTELLWAVFHLSEELAVREDLQHLLPSDGIHIAGDIQRAYTILIVEWLAYMKHLKQDYPYTVLVRRTDESLRSERVTHHTIDGTLPVRLIS